MAADEALVGRTATEGGSKAARAVLGTRCFSLFEADLHSNLLFLTHFYGLLLKKYRN
jgi:hypothetical protein